jgi:hypothetical protein
LKFINRMSHSVRSWVHNQLVFGQLLNETIHD